MAARECVEEIYRQQQEEEEGDSSSSSTNGGTGKTCMRKTEDGLMEVIVAVRQGNILATAFHPELTNERWWHSYFISLCR